MLVEFVGGTHDGMSLDLPINEDGDLPDEWKLPCKNEPEHFSYRGKPVNYMPPIERYIRAEFRHPESKIPTFKYCINGFFN